MRPFRAKIRFRTVQNLLLAAIMATVSILVWPSQRIESPVLEPLRSAETMAFDALFYLRGTKPARVDPRIVVVGFERDTEVTLGQTWPVKRSVHAQVIRNLKKAGARLICYDFLFTGPTSPEDDRDLEAALKEAGNVVLTCRIDRDSVHSAKRYEGPYYDDALGIDLESVARVGFAEVPQDLDGVVRRTVPTMQLQDEWLPSFAASGLLFLQGIDATHIRVEPRSVRLGRYVLDCTGPTLVDHVDKSVIPSAYVDFPGGIVFPMDVSFQQVYTGQMPSGYFRDKIVFVGITGVDLAKMLGEKYATSYTRLRPEVRGGATTTEIPGVVVQAHMLNALLRGSVLRLLPAETVWAIVFLTAWLAASLARRWSNWRGPASLVACVGGYFGLSAHLFGMGWHLPWLIPILLIFASTSVVAQFERGTLKRKWSGYVSPAVFERILRDEGDTAAERYEATVLFGDIRGFTTLSDQRSPERVVRLLNLHFERLTERIYRESGTIDKFMGDGILAVFGAPIPHPQSAARAVRAALDMREASLEPLADEGEQLVLATGFGIATGPFVAGHVGSRQRHDFTVIGDVVNVASRLQGVTGEPDVIIDAATYDLVRELVEVESLGEVALKGKPQPVPCYKVLRWKGR